MKKPYEILPSGKGAPSSGGGWSVNEMKPYQILPGAGGTTREIGGWAKGSVPTISGGTSVQGYGVPSASETPYMLTGPEGVPIFGSGSPLKGSNPYTNATYGGVPLVGRQSKSYEIMPGAGIAGRELRKPLGGGCQGTKVGGCGCLEGCSSDGGRNFSGAGIAPLGLIESIAARGLHSIDVHSLVADVRVLAARSSMAASLQGILDMADAAPATAIGALLSILDRYGVYLPPAIHLSAQQMEKVLRDAGQGNGGAPTGSPNCVGLAQLISTVDGLLDSAFLFDPELDAFRQNIRQCMNSGGGGDPIQPPNPCGPAPMIGGSPLSHWLACMDVWAVTPWQNQPRNPARCLAEARRTARDHGWLMGVLMVDIMADVSQARSTLWACQNSPGKFGPGSPLDRGNCYRLGGALVFAGLLLILMGALGPTNPGYDPVTGKNDPRFASGRGSVGVGSILIGLGVLEGVYCAVTFDPSRIP